VDCWNIYGETGSEIDCEIGFGIGGKSGYKTCRLSNTLDLSRKNDIMRSYEKNSPSQQVGD